MLLEFRLANFRSYSADKRFSMVAGSGKELPTNTMTVQGFERYPLLRSASIYGANASGKSNLIHAFAFFRYFVLRSAENRQEEDKIPVYPFMLDPELAKKPSEFEMTFILNGVRHEYGFVVSQDRVYEEWLTVYPKGKPQEWFQRTTDTADKPHWSLNRTHLKGDKSQLAERTRDNCAFPIRGSTVEPPPNHAHLWMVQESTQSVAQGSQCDELYAKPDPPEPDIPRMAHRYSQSGRHGHQPGARQGEHNS